MTGRAQKEKLGAQTTREETSISKDFRDEELDEVEDGEAGASSTFNVPPTSFNTKSGIIP